MRTLQWYHSPVAWAYPVRLGTLKPSRLSAWPPAHPELMWLRGRDTGTPEYKDSHWWWISYTVRRDSSTHLWSFIWPSEREIPFSVCIHICMAHLANLHWAYTSNATIKVTRISVWSRIYMSAKSKSLHFELRCILDSAINTLSSFLRWESLLCFSFQVEVYSWHRTLRTYIPRPLQAAHYWSAVAWPFLGRRQQRSCAIKPELSSTIKISYRRIHIYRSVALEYQFAKGSQVSL